jgi:membrane fusion protein, copper/silver efflux system
MSKRTLLICVLGLALIFVLTSCAKTAAAPAQYQCPMHPTYISDKRGDCPICGMKLVPVKTKTAPEVAKRYACPMHPEVTSDGPGTCPKCGMALEPVKRDAEGVPTDGQKVLYYRNPMDPAVTSPVPMKDAMGMDYIPVHAAEGAGAGSTVAGRAPVDLDARGMELAGIQTAPAAREPLARTILAVGSVLPDETRIRHIHTRISGWIEKLYADFTGQWVKKGDPVLTIYSPELLAGQEEFLSAKAAYGKFSASSVPDVREGAGLLVDAARRRLQLFDVPQAFIEELEKSGTVKRAVTLTAPAGGYITAKDVFEGQRVGPETDLYVLTDLSTVWIEADIYENEEAGVKAGDRAVVTLPHDPGVRLEGRIAYIYPTLNPETRTLRVRLAFPNPRLTLKPAMYANVEIASAPVDAIVVPDGAVLDSGTRKLVFVETAPGTFSPREVVVGLRSGGKTQVASGLAVGERVAVKANFLLDSESRLKAALAMPEGRAAGTPEGGTDKSGSRFKVQSSTSEGTGPRNQEQPGEKP